MDYLRGTGIKEYTATQGNRGVLVLRRVREDRAEFLLISFWDSFEAIRRFAGPDPDQAVFYPKDKEFFVEMDPEAAHYEVLFEARDRV